MARSRGGEAAAAPGQLTSVIAATASSVANDAELDTEDEGQEAPTYDMATREGFESYRADLLGRVPAEVKARFREGGFALDDDWLPMLEVGPFDIMPGRLRDMWISRFNEALESGGDNIRLVFWYGLDHDPRSQRYAFVPGSRVISYEEGVRRGYADVPEKIQTKIEKNEKLTETEEQILYGLADIDAEMKKDKSERASWMVQFKEEYELAEEEAESRLGNISEGKSEISRSVAPALDAGSPQKEKCVYDTRKLRSKQSQEQWLRKGKTPKKCEHCGVDDGQYKLRACSGCGLALYCSVACQKAARGSHRRICSMFSELPPNDADRLVLAFDKDEKNDFDACLRYATKYMDNLKHLDIRLVGMCKDDKVKLTEKKLSSLLRSKKGMLDSICLVSDSESDLYVPALFDNSYNVWKELHGLKQLRLFYMQFDDVQHICDIIHQQSEDLEVLSLPFLESDWNRASCRKAFASAVSSCKKLVTLDLHVNTLQDAELEVMLNDLPNLRCLCLRRNVNYSSLRGLTDKSCAIFARKCPNIQELNLDHHDKLSVKGIRKIFKGCIHLQSFHTTTLNMSCKDILSLLNIAPQLLCLYLNKGIDLPDDKTNAIIEATGGRTLIGFGGVISDPGQPGAILSAKTIEKYQQQRAVYRGILNKVISRYDDPEVTNIWKDM